MTMKLKRCLGVLLGLLLIGIGTTTAQSQSSSNNHFYLTVMLEVSAFTDQNGGNRQERFEAVAEYLVYLHNFQCEFLNEVAVEETEFISGYRHPKLHVGVLMYGQTSQFLNPAQPFSDLSQSCGTSRTVNDWKRQLNEICNIRRSRESFCDTPHIDLLNAQEKVMSELRTNAIPGANSALMYVGLGVHCPDPNPCNQYLIRPSPTLGQFGVDLNTMFTGAGSQYQLYSNGTMNTLSRGYPFIYLLSLNSTNRNGVFNNINAAWRGYIARGNVRSVADVPPSTMNLMASLLGAFNDALEAEQFLAKSNSRVQSLNVTQQSSMINITPLNSELIVYTAFPLGNFGGAAYGLEMYPRSQPNNVLRDPNSRPWIQFLKGDKPPVGAWTFQALSNRLSDNAIGVNKIYVFSKRANFKVELSSIQIYQYRPLTVTLDAGQTVDLTNVEFRGQIFKRDPNNPSPSNDDSLSLEMVFPKPSSSATRFTLTFPDLQINSNLLKVTVWHQSNMYEEFTQEHLFELRAVEINVNCPNDGNRRYYSYEPLTPQVTVTITNPFSGVPRPDYLLLNGVDETDGVWQATDQRLFFDFLLNPANSNAIPTPNTSEIVQTYQVEGAVMLPDVTEYTIILSTNDNRPVSLPLTQCTYRRTDLSINTSTTGFDPTNQIFTVTIDASHQRLVQTYPVRLVWRITDATGNVCLDGQTPPATSFTYETPFSDLTAEVNFTPWLNDPSISAILANCATPARFEYQIEVEYTPSSFTQLHPQNSEEWDKIEFDLGALLSGN